jgi:DNA damage-binding protein 1
LEIWRITDGLLSLVHATSINGTISMLQRLRPVSSSTDLLFVGTERFHYFTAQWDPKTNRLKVEQKLDDTSERHMRDSQSQDRCVVDPSGRFMALHLWEGVLNVLRLHTIGKRKLELEHMDQVRLSELFVKGSVFVPTETNEPTIAFLYQTRSDSTDSKLALYKLTSDDKNKYSSRFIKNRDRIFHMDLEDGTGLLIPVPKVEEEIKRHNVRNPDTTKAQLGGLLIAGETQLVYFDVVTQATVRSQLDEPAIFVAWAEYDPSHYFLADDYGALHLLKIVTEGVVVTEMIVRKIGTTSRASCLEYFGNGLLFVGSHYGDSQLFYIDVYNLATEKENHLELLQRLPNIAPVLDFAVMDMGNREGDKELGNEYSSGQARIVTGSGVHQDGSLRSVRSGVGLEDVGILGEMKNVRGLFSLKSSTASKVDTLVASFLTETRAFQFGSTGEIEEVESFAGLRFESQTLLAMNVSRDRLLQVTSTTATLVDIENGMAITSWDPPEGKAITRASANSKSLLLSVDGTLLVSLNIANDLELLQQKDLSEADQVSCVHVAPGLDNIGVIGFWASGSISIIDLNTLQPIHSEPMRRTESSASVPRDLALVQMLPPGLLGPTLLVSLEDGNVISFSVAADMSLSGRKSVVLGTKQARFHLLPKDDGIYTILATSEHPSFIYAAQGRIVYSAVTADDAEYVCPFDAVAFPDSIVVATESEIKISQIDNERRSHVKPLEMGKMVRRLAYSPKEKVFGLGCIRRDLVNGEERIQSSFELVDEVVFEKLGKPFLLETVEYLEMVEAVIRAELPDAYGQPAERFIVGTSFLPNLDTAINSQNRGRIIVLGVDSERNPYMVMNHTLKGGCRALAVMGSKIVAALTKTVIVNQYIETSTTSGQMIRLASYRPATYPIDVAVDGNMIAVGDLMKSLALVEFVPGEDNEKAELVEHSRHYHSAWATAVCHVEGESWLQADAEGNLAVLRRNTDGVTAENKRRMELVSELNLGEMVNRIRKINVETSPNAMVIPKAFLATVRRSYSFQTLAQVRITIG